MSSVREKILIIDDEELVRWPLAKKLDKEGYSIVQAENGKEGISTFDREDVDLVLLDLKLPDMSGVDILKNLKEREPDLLVVMMTGYGTVENAVDAMRSGAYDFIRKPFNPEEILAIIDKALELRRLQKEVETLRMKARPNDLESVVGESTEMKRVINLAKMIAASETANILILGESGTGKNLLAEVIHNHSSRSAQPYLTINCSAVSPQTIESELFGHERGAFTDAKITKKGLCEVANGGTLILDEVSELPLEIQSKVLKLIESSHFRRIGGTRNINVDLRIIAATNRDLRNQVRKGTFRDDLFYRLNGSQIEIPALRTRSEDIPYLADYFIKKFNRRLNKNIEKIAAEALDYMKSYSWPGNIREFQNMIERSMILSESSVLKMENFPSELTANGHSGNNTFLLPPDGINFEQMERSLVRQALEKANWNQTRAARLLGFTRDQMRYRVKQFKLT